MSHFSGKLVLSLEIRICSGFYKVLSKRRDKGQIPIFSNSWDFGKVDATVLKVLDGTVKCQPKYCSLLWFHFGSMDLLWPLGALAVFSERETLTVPDEELTTLQKCHSAAPRLRRSWSETPCHLTWTTSALNQSTSHLQMQNKIAQIQIHNKNINTEYAGPEKTNTNTHDVGLKLKVCTAKYINL